MSDRLILWTTIGSLVALLAGCLAVALGPDLVWRFKHRHRGRLKRLEDRVS